MRDDGLPRAFGAYTLLSLKGKGGSGSVYLARANAPSNAPVVVLKTLTAEVSRDPVELLRFRHEAMISVAITSPHVARVYEVGTVGDQPYIAMEHVEGWALSRLMDAALEAARPLPVPLVAAWLVDALHGLRALHVAVHPETQEPLAAVHRDITPKNLMVGRDLSVRVIDFGLGTSSAQEWATRAGVMLGTPGYMPPEQRGGARIDPRSDVYALGVVGWELLTLKRYAEDRSPGWRSVGRPDVPPELEAHLARALELDVERRFATAEEMRLAIEPFAARARDWQLPGALLEELEVRDEDVTEAHAWAADPGTLVATVEPTQIFARRSERAELAKVSAPPPRGRARAGVIAPAIAALAAALALWPRVVEAPRATSPAPTEAPAAAPVAVALVATTTFAASATVTVAVSAPRALLRRAPSTSAEPRSPPASVPSKASPPPTPREALEALMRQAAVARRARPEHREEIDDLLADASMWSRSKDPAQAMKQLAELSARLTDLAVGPR